MFIEILLIIFGFALLIKGADYLVDGASDIAKKFHIPEVIIALTIVSIGTSLPELVVSLSSAINGYSDMSMGNVVGSNIANLFLILGVSAIINPIEVKKQTRLFEIPINLFAVLILYVLANGFIGTNILSREEGIVLLIFTVLFILYNIFMAKNAKKFDKSSIENISHKEMKNINVFKSIFMITIGIILLKFGGDFVIDNSVSIASKLGLSEKLISVTIIAIGTSLPELITSVMAAIKGESDMAIGNVVGSCIFNIFLILGVSSSITPINYLSSYNVELYFLIIGGILLWIFPYTKINRNKVSRGNGLLYVVIYIIYMIYTIMGV